MNVAGSGPAGPVAQAARSVEHRNGAGGVPHGLLLLASQSACEPKQKMPAPFGTPLATLGWSDVCM